jgi:hypothetical protein
MLSGLMCSNVPGFATDGREGVARPRLLYTPFSPGRFMFKLDEGFLILDLQRIWVYVDLYFSP